MSKRNYTHVQAYLPQIQAMIEAGKSQREIAEHFGFRDKTVVKYLLMRERKKQIQGIPKAENSQTGKDIG